MFMEIKGSLVQHQELSSLEKDAIRPYIEDVQIRQTDPLDPKYLPINEQIYFEETVVFLAIDRLNDGIGLGESPVNPNIGGTVKRITRKIRDVRDSSRIEKRKTDLSLLSRRLLELNVLWHREDKKIRETSGANLEDLGALLKEFKISSVSQADLKRPDNSKDYYFLESSERSYLDDNIDLGRQPKYKVKLFGNTAILPDEVFDAIVEKHNLGNKALLRQSNYCMTESPPDFKSLPTLKYRLFVPWKNWQLGRDTEFAEDKDADKLPLYPKDASQKLVYFQDSLLYPGQVYKKPKS